jgi:hypothetical protein
MKYFLHDTSAFEDEKISLLYINYGYEGLGLFYTLLEKLAKQEKPVNTSVLKKQLNVGKKLEKCWKFMEEIDIISSSNGETFNKQLLNFSEKYQIKKEKTRNKLKEWRENQTDKKNVTSYEPVRNPPKVKESKVKESKEEYINSIKAKFNFSFLANFPNYDGPIFEWLYFQFSRDKEILQQQRIEALTRELYRISKKNSDEAMQIVDKAMSGNWENLHKINEEKTEAKSEKNKEGIFQTLCKDGGGYEYWLTEQEFIDKKEKHNLTKTENTRYAPTF